MNNNIISTVTLSLLLISTPVIGREMQTLEKLVPADSQVRLVRLTTDIGPARFDLVSHPGGDIFNGSVRYRADRIETDIAYDAKGSTGEIRLTSRQFRHKLQRDSDDASWDVSLSRGVTWDLTLDLGISQCRLDLSGVPVENLRLDIGASECQVEFDEANPVTMASFSVDAGAGELRLFGLGYANFDRMSFDGGAGEFVLNFEGMGAGRHKVDIDVGAGEVRLELPRGYPVRIRADEGWLSDVEVQHHDVEQVSEGTYESEGYDQADRGLEINLDIGMGEAKIVRVGSAP